MQSDRELLELAAKAADCGVRWEVDYGCYSVPSEHGPRRWNPFTDDGDAFRVAVKLRLDVMHNDPQDNDAWVMVQTVDCVEYVDGESYRAAATRRAIVRAAAAIGGDSNG